MELNDIESEITLQDSESNVELHAILGVPKDPLSLILFAHGSGSGRFSPRNNAVARVLQKAGMSTLLLDLLTEEESEDRSNVFDIALLADRLDYAKRIVSKRPEFSKLPIGYFGASTGAGAALVAAAQWPENIYAVVSRGGRSDLAGVWLEKVLAPTLLLVGSRDEAVMDLNQLAFEKMHCMREIKIIPGATHLFEEPGALEQVATLASQWFIAYAS